MALLCVPLNVVSSSSVVTITTQSTDQTRRYRRNGTHVKHATLRDTTKKHDKKRTHAMGQAET